ncbi:hypothetical protein FBU59_002769 [Linderina macrospora]|uniref:Uncharacterized protein n=1 Tax=Linderina macrospora TaxID=4868 RepID=A0ACC1JAG0_9FUNG|nr:hypothetical protein FBU59_002769 [Linderina macrospora]
MQKLDYIDPLLRPESQFVAYRQMRDKKLAKYRLSLDDQLSGRRSSTPLQLSHRHELRWDTLSDALRQRLGMQLDILGDETQKARSITGRALTESPTNAVPVQETPGIVTLEEKLSAFHHSNSYDSEGGAIDDVVGMGPRDYNQASTLPMYAENSSSERLQQNRHIDARQFHDAIWHFTLGQFNIYEELYYYRKYCSDAECQSTIPAQLRRPTPAYTQDLTAVEMVMDLDLDADRYTSLQTQHPSHWINDELKAHIRAVLWNPSGISATSAQPPVAAALNLSTEEMVRINLIISLARRQAEIIHAMRALYEYENPSRN